MTLKIIISILTISICFVSCKNETSKIDYPVVKEIKAPQNFTFPPLPKEMTFAGKKIILKDIDIRERLDREVMVEAYFHSATTGGLKRATRFFPKIERWLKENNIPEDFKYLAVIESNLLQAVSPVGAQGIWQFMPATAKSFGLEMSNEVDERLHFEKSTKAACAYLNEAYNATNDWLLAAAAYNRGLGGVINDMKWQGSDHYFDTEQNSETARYVYRILAIKLIHENPREYGYDVEKMERYKPIKTKRIEISSSISNLSTWALEKGYNFKIIQKLNPWLIDTKLTVKNKKTYYIELPSDDEALKPYKQYLQ